MDRSLEDDMRVVQDYHERTKHHWHRWAAAPWHMDWRNQPDPFREFSGAPQLNLSHPELRATPTYDSLFTGGRLPSSLDAHLIAKLFYHSLAISAWKQNARTTPWSLRINPSSGCLHPTEGYLVSGIIPGLINTPGVFQYSPFQHRLERRCQISSFYRSGSS